MFLQHKLGIMLNPIIAYCILYRAILFDVKLQEIEPLYRDILFDIKLQEIEQLNRTILFEIKYAMSCHIKYLCLYDMEYHTILSVTRGRGMYFKSLTH